MRRSRRQMLIASWCTPSYTTVIGRVSTVPETLSSCVAPRSLRWCRGDHTQGYRLDRRLIASVSVALVVGCMEALHPASAGNGQLEALAAVAGVDSIARREGSERPLRDASMRVHRAFQRVQSVRSFTSDRVHLRRRRRTVRETSSGDGRGQHAVGGEKTGVRGDTGPCGARGAREFGDVQGTGPAEGDDGEVDGIVATLYGNDPQRSLHRSVGYGQDALGSVLESHAQCFCDVRRGGSMASRSRDGPPPRKASAGRRPEPDMRVGDRDVRARRSRSRWGRAGPRHSVDPPAAPRQRRLERSSHRLPLPYGCRSPESQRAAHQWRTRECEEAARGRATRQSRFRPCRTRAPTRSPPGGPMSARRLHPRLGLRARCAQARVARARSGARRRWTP